MKHTTVQTSHTHTSHTLRHTQYTTHRVHISHTSLTHHISLSPISHHISHISPAARLPHDVCLASLSATPCLPCAAPPLAHSLSRFLPQRGQWRGFCVIFFSFQRLSTLFSPPPCSNTSTSICVTTQLIGCKHTSSAPPNTMMPNQLIRRPLNGGAAHAYLAVNEALRIWT